MAEGLVAYSKGGNWMPTFPGQTCEYCGTTYTAHKYGQRFCSKSCSSRARIAKNPPKKVEKTCPTCKTVRLVNPSDKSKFCSLKCAGIQAIRKDKWQDRSCAHCGETFRSQYRNNRKGFERFCSSSCANAAKRTRKEAECAACGASYIPLQPRQKTCSWECRNKLFIRDNTPAWKGGVVQQLGRTFRRIDREGYAGKYEGEHRLVAAREIGRPLRRGEVTVCLDGNNDNHDPANLYLCPNNREWALLRNGVVAWPSESNLRQYRERGYVRPDVILVLHEWENGVRMLPSGSRVTRHPQADEIIKRRRAGATVKQLAAAFGCAHSSMAATLKRRL